MFKTVSQPERIRTYPKRGLTRKRTAHLLLLGTAETHFVEADDVRIHTTARITEADR